ncbi:MAG TPA: nucleotidyltransferase family protein [Alphaproteobacteria bacterium]|nr:nucleotidyltransferase family protein [Alphaproteobacteria bacterium]
MSVDTALAGVVLAAGESRRMGTPKQLLPFGDRTILERVVDTLLAAGVGEVIVVLGHLADRMREVLGERPVQTVVNERYRDGMLSSIKTGVQAIGMEFDAVLFALGDQPHIESAIVRQIIIQYRTGTEGIVIPRYGAKKGHPIIVNLHKYREAILNLPEHVGLNALMQEHAGDVRLLDVVTDDILRDIDVPEDYTRELARFTERRSCL